MAKKKKVAKVGAIDLGDIRGFLNKKAGNKVAFDLREENPADVKYWIPTGSTWLDSIICRGRKAGIPGGRVVEIAGLSSTGKSYMAMQIAANAQKMGMPVVYFDSEAAVNTDFVEKAGVDTESLIYVTPDWLEQCLEMVEDLMAQYPGQRMLFILDSLAACPAKADVDGDMNPNSSVGVVARIMSKAFKKTAVALSQNECTFIILNQLKTNITAISKAPMGGKYLTDGERYTTPGGKSPEYFASCRIWLTKSNAKKLQVTDEKGFKIGSHVKARLHKSRFGTEHRTCEFKILWGDEVGIQDEESLIEAIKPSSYITLGKWNSLEYADGTSQKWQGDSGFVKLMKEDEKFRSRVDEILEEEVIMKFDRREGDASNYYDPEPEEKDKKEAS